MSRLATSRLSRSALAALFAALLLTRCAPPPEGDPDAALPPGPYPIAVDPEPGATGVLIDKVIRIEFSDHLDGRHVTRSKFSLHSGPLDLWVMAFYDPVRGRLSVWPSASMWKNATWVLELNEGLTGLDGSPVEPVQVTEFRTGELGGDNQPFPFLNYAEHVAPIFDARCTGCHGEDGIADLRLDSAEGVAGTALGIPSTGWPEWNRITTSRPGESYLLYKIIGDERISGLPMPRSWDAADPAPPLAADEREAISDWIASGAAFFDQGAGGQ